MNLLYIHTGQPHLPPTFAFGPRATTTHRYTARCSHQGWTDNLYTDTPPSGRQFRRGNTHRYRGQDTHPGWPLFFNNDFPWLFHNQKNEFPRPIGTAYFFRNKWYTIYECLPEKIYFQLLVNQSVSKTSETTNRMIFTETKIPVHFYKKKSRTSSSFSTTFHDLGCFPWLSGPGKWSY